jgi:cold shock CspA family protein
MVRIDKKYGFISDGRHESVFLHLSQIEAAGPRSLLPGTLVEFDIGHRPQARCALRACPVKNTPP